MSEYFNCSKHYSLLFRVCQTVFLRRYSGRPSVPSHVFWLQLFKLSLELIDVVRRVSRLVKVSGSLGRRLDWAKCFDVLCTRVHYILLSVCCRWDLMLMLALAFSILVRLGRFGTISGLLRHWSTFCYSSWWSILVSLLFVSHELQLTGYKRFWAHRFISVNWNALYRLLFWQFSLCKLVSSTSAVLHDCIIKLLLIVILGGVLDKAAYGSHHLSVAIGSTADWLNQAFKGIAFWLLNVVD